MSSEQKTTQPSEVPTIVKASCLPWNVVSDALSRPYCSSPSPAGGSDRRKWLETESAKEERKVINTSMESLSCLPGRGQESHGALGKRVQNGPKVGASCMFITVTFLYATRRQCGISFGGQMKVGSNPSSSHLPAPGGQETSGLSASVSPL